MKRKVVAAMAGTFLAILVSTGWAQAQTVRTPGTVTINGTSCNGLGFNSGTVCADGVVTCAAPIMSINFTLGMNPAAVGTQQKGTIVFFGGGDGTEVNFNSYITPQPNSYNSLGFQTVQVVWGAPWEQNGTGGPPSSIKDAACRPAAILDWVFHLGHVYNGGGRCAQGGSAGSAAIAYSMAEYGEYNYLDNVELTSGPVLSDIALGCQTTITHGTV